MTIIRGAARGGQGGQSPLEFGRSINHFQTKGVDYAPHTPSSLHPPTPRIQKAIYASDNEVSFQYEIMEKPLFQ